MPLSRLLSFLQIPALVVEGGLFGVNALKQASFISTLKIALKTADRINVSMPLSRLLSFLQGMTLVIDTVNPLCQCP